MIQQQPQPQRTANHLLHISDAQDQARGESYTQDLTERHVLLSEGPLKILTTSHLISLLSEHHQFIVVHQIPVS